MLKEIYSKKEVQTSKIPYSTFEKFPDVSDPQYYVPYSLCVELDLLKHFNEPSLFGLSLHPEYLKPSFYSLFNVKGLIPYYDYYEARKSGFFTPNDLEVDFGLDYKNFQRILGFTYHSPLDDFYSTDRTFTYEWFHCLYDISKTDEFLQFEINQMF